MWACWVNRDSDRHPRTGHRVRSAHADQALPDNGGSKTAHLVQMLDSTVVRAHVSAAGAKGGSKIRRWAFAPGIFQQNPPQDRL
jgi:hypothetical protein